MSSHQVESTTTLIAGEALEAYRGVKINSSGKAVYADAGERAQYITLAAVAADEEVGCRSLNAGGSFEGELEAAVTNLGAAIYLRNDGKFSESSADSAIQHGWAKGTGAIGSTAEIEIYQG